MNGAKYLGQLFGAFVVLGVSLGFQDQAAAAERLRIEQAQTLRHATSRSVSESALHSAPAPSTSIITPSWFSGRLLEDNLSLKTPSNAATASILVAEGYTPPDNGGPDSSRGSGSR